MPTKHQDKCYRTIKGEKYMNFCDVLGEIDFQAVDMAKQLKLRRRLIKHPDGYRQLFIHKDDEQKLAKAL